MTGVADKRSAGWAVHRGLIREDQTIKVRGGAEVWRWNGSKTRPFFARRKLTAGWRLSLNPGFAFGGKREHGFSA